MWGLGLRAWQLLAWVLGFSNLELSNFMGGLGCEGVRNQKDPFKSAL